MHNTKTIPIRRMVLVVNEVKQSVQQQLPSILENCNRAGMHTTMHPLSQLDILKTDDYDAIVSVGGDGTLLSVVPYALATKKTIIGVNCGRLGFLTMYSVEDFVQALPLFLQGNYKTVRRHILQAQTCDRTTFFALNDIVIKSKALRLVPLDVYLNSGVWVTHARSDGMIFCTSTGSTAYNLSAHGPVLHPSSSTWCMTPICPHDFFNRTLVFDNSIHLYVKTKEDVEVVVDGKKLPNIKLPLTLGIAKKTIVFTQPDNFSYFENLRTKFNW
ncbi:MAG: NAD(+)/NADH kinase [Puniceicoccales bacterium]|nr:NAD(+)/NADH kinase [Puniceicoccales bacterium]